LGAAREVASTASIPARLAGRQPVPDFIGIYPRRKYADCRHKRLRELLR
jgi:hypothetical protein